MINARAETVAEKPAFRAAFRHRRCLIPADGYYEWQAAGERKQPWFIHKQDDGLFAFAGLWEHWEGQAGDTVDSCTILVTDATTALRPIHDRVPVILAPQDYDRWLAPDTSDPAALLPLLQNAQAQDLIAIPVSTRVNSPRNEDEGCIAPVELPAA